MKLTTEQAAELHTLMVAPLDDEDLDERQCAKCGDDVLVLPRDEFSRGDWCWRCCADAWHKVKEHLPALLADHDELVRGRAALVQARGALTLDRMVDGDGKPFGTTTVALEAIDAALAESPTS